jgi:transcriptional regulator of heat shock response
MKDRTLQILSALIHDFIETANPVASQRLLESGKFKISSATVRNEFALLEEVGLIESPHVSAGKIPTTKGYRFFVDEIIEKEAKTEEKMVELIFQKHLEEYKIAKSKESLFDVLRLVAQLSGNVAFVTIDNDRTFYLGLSNVIRSPEFIRHPEQAAQVAEILEGRERFQKLIKNLDIPDGEIKIFIGEENVLEEISSCAMLVTRFETQNLQGAMGILGPIRMGYGFNKALLQNALEMVL